MPLPDALVAEVFGGRTETIKSYVDILLDRGIAWGLLGPREGDRVWERHILNSVSLAPLIGETAAVVDVGSGAGLPGLPLAILRPDLAVTLVEPMARRTEFLRQAVAELGLVERVQVVRSRAEDHPGRYDVVVSRAVAPLVKLSQWCAPMMADGGCCLALKGSSANEELDGASDGLRRLGLSGRVRELAVPGGGTTWAVELRRR